MTAATLLSLPSDRACLVEIAQLLVAGDKGLLAIDESISTRNKRFAALGIAQDEPTRRAYREMIVTTPGLDGCISGVILFDETIRQDTTDGVPLVTVLAAAGIIPGIKVDLGAKPMAGHPGERVSEGLDGLRERLAGYAAVGARFAKWRAVFTIGAGTPSRACVEANAHALARLRRAVPAAVAGIAFLSGGQSGDLASARLNAINTHRSLLPWPVAFSFGRAIQQPALTIWDGHSASVNNAQHALLRRSKSNQDARRGQYTPAVHE